MDKETLAHFKTLIENKIDEVLQQINDSANCMNTSERFADEGEESQRNTDNSIARATHNRRIKHVASLRKALERIKTGDFGYCESCGYEIDKERLLLVLDTDMCSTCSTLAFEKSKHRRAA